VVLPPAGAEELMALGVADESLAADMAVPVEESALLMAAEESAVALESVASVGATFLWQAARDRAMAALQSTSLMGVAVLVVMGEPFSNGMAAKKLKKSGFCSCGMKTDVARRAPGTFVHPSGSPVLPSLP
jgi:hypothetical protein